MDINAIITTYIVPYLPMIATVISSVITFLKMFKSATASFKKVDHTSEEISSKLKDITFTLNTVLSENAELKKQNRELKTMITHVMEEDDEK